MQLVNQPCAQILPNDGYTATEVDVAVARCSNRLLQSYVNAFSDKAELCTSRHPERCPRKMRQYEDGRVIRRLIAPPALPVLVRPGAPYRTEHVTSDDPGTDSSKALLCNTVIDTGLSIIMAVHPPPYACVEEPIHQLKAPDADRVLEVLVRPGTIAVNGNCETLDTEFRHLHSSLFGQWRGLIQSNRLGPTQPESPCESQTVRDDVFYTYIQIVPLVARFKRGMEGTRSLHHQDQALFFL